MQSVELKALTERAVGLRRKFGRLDILTTSEGLGITRSEAVEVLEAMKNGTTTRRKVAKPSKKAKGPAKRRARRAKETKKY